MTESETRLGGFHISKSRKFSTTAIAVLFFLGLALIGGESTNSGGLSNSQCSDGIDNDGDGTADANDPQCSAFVSFSEDPGQPDNYQYCPNWDDETSAPTLSQCN